MDSRNKLIIDYQSSPQPQKSFRTSTVIKVSIGTQLLTFLVAAINHFSSTQLHIARYVWVGYITMTALILLRRARKLSTSDQVFIMFAYFVMYAVVAFAIQEIGKKRWIP